MNPDQEEIARLVTRLQDTENRLRELAGDQVDAVLTSAGDSYLLRDAQQQLRRREASLRELAGVQTAILDAIPAQVALVDEQEYIVSVNEAWRRFARDNGLPDENDGVGDNYLAACEAAGPDDSGFEATAAAVGIRAILAGERDEFSLEYPCHSPDEQRWFRLLATATERGRASGAVVMHLDITERYLAAEHLRQSEAQYRLLFDNNPQPMWAYDLETLGFLAVNDAAVDHYGYSRDEFLAMSIADIRPGEDISRLLDNVSRVTEDEVDHAGYWRHRRKNGDLIDVEITSHKLIFDGRDAELVLANDVTARLRAERDLRQLNRSQAMLSQGNEALLRLRTEEELLQAIADIAVDTGNYSVAWVGFAEHDERRSIRRMAYAGDESYRVALEQFPLSWSGDIPEGRSISGRTVREGRSQVMEDITRDPLFTRLITVEAVEHKTLLCLPLRDSSGNTFGLMALYSRYNPAVPADEISICQQLADNLAFGIELLRAEDKRTRLEAAVIKSAAGISTSTGLDFFAQLTTHIAAAISADACYIARMVRSESGDIRAGTLAGVVDGVPGPALDIPITDTPCQHLKLHRELVVSEGIRELYPGDKDLAALKAEAYVGIGLEDSAGRLDGILFVLYRTPLRERDFVVSVLRIFAARAAAELERQAVEQRLREQASLLDQVRDAIIASDMEGRVRYWSRGAEDVYGWSAGEAMGRIMGYEIFADHRQRQQAMTQVLNEGEFRGRLEHRRKDGQTITIEAHWTLTYDNDGQPRGMLGLNSDISDRLKLEEQLQQSQRLEAVGQLTGGVAHDFNNLLTVIMGNAELLNERLENQPALQRLAKMIESASQRGSDLTHRLLAFARRQPLEPDAVDANQLLVGMEDLLRRTISENVEMELVRSAGLWHAMVDPSQLEGALLNLCINARDAMPQGGRLTLETANVYLERDYVRQYDEVEPGEYVMLAVSDTGTGIPKGYLDRLFDPFFTTKERGKGTGLGLSMVFGFIKQSRGHIRVYSEEGEGTTIRMYLPRAEPGDNSRRVEAPRAASGPITESATILLVEDDVLVLDFARSMLETAGYQVLHAYNGTDALEIIKVRGDIDLLFTDVVMPGGISGKELADRAREVRPELRVLFTSGYTENAIVHHGRLDADVPLLSKPYRQANLLRKIRLVLSGAD